MQKESKKSASTSLDVGVGGSHYDELPLDICKLPSKGVVYDEDHPLYMKEGVEFKAMTAQEENILATPALLKNGKVLSVLIKSCLINKSIDPENLLIGDKSALLLAIRISGFGPEYKAQTICPSCKQSSVYEFNLSNGKIKPLGAEPVQKGKNLFEFTLPLSKKKVLFSLPIDKDDLEIAQTQERRKKNYKSALIDTTVTDRLITAIKEVDGKTDKDFIVKFVYNLRVKDSRALRRYMHKIEPDIVIKEEVNCRHCGEFSERFVPIGYEFFWPSEPDE